MASINNEHNANGHHGNDPLDNGGRDGENPNDTTAADDDFDLTFTQNLSDLIFGPIAFPDGRVLSLKPFTLWRNILADYKRRGRMDDAPSFHPLFCYDPNWRPGQTQVIHGKMVTEDGILHFVGRVTTT